MEIYYVKLTPAKPNALVDFSTTEAKKCITEAISATNKSSTYTKTEKSVSIIQICKSSILLRLISKSVLTTPSKSLSGFSRALLDKDNERKENGLTELFTPAIYNRSLFSSELLRPNSDLLADEPISDSSALKFMVDLIFAPPSECQQETLSEIKAILKKYFVQN